MLFFEHAHPTTAQTTNEEQNKNHPKPGRMPGGEAGLLRSRPKRHRGRRKRAANANAHVLNQQLTERFSDAPILKIITVKKKSFSDNFRVLFVMGLEGTGHHTWTRIYQTCVTSGTLCDFRLDIQDLLYSGGAQPVGIFAYGMNKADSDTLITRRRDKLVTILAGMQQKYSENGREKSRLLFLNTANATEMMSYPSWDGADKAMRHPDVALLAALCERAGVDLRIVVMTRDASSVLRSTVRRGFGGGDRAFMAAVLSDNAMVMAAQLQLISPAFWRCVELSDLGSEAVTWSHLGPFVHPELDSKSTARNLSTPSDIQSQEHDQAATNAGSSGSLSGASMQRLVASISLLQNTCRRANGTAVRSG